MKKLLPLFIGIFVAALAAGAGFGARRAQLIAAVVAADSATLASAESGDTTSVGMGVAVNADSIHGDDMLADSASADSSGRSYVLGASDDPAGAARAAAAADGGRAAPASDLAAAVTVPTEAAATAAAPVAAAAPTTSADIAPAVTVRRLAKIFGTMAPRDAAKVLAELGDDDVHTLISYLSDRQAAAVMGSIPPERAAKITGMTMRLARENP